MARHSASIQTMLRLDDHQPAPYRDGAQANGASMKINSSLQPADLLPQVTKVLELACKKVRAIDQRWDPSQGTPVFTINGKYATRGWTEWTQGFQYGSSLLCFDGTDDRELLELGRKRTLERMAPHVTHMGVHDHGFNNISTYGNLRRLMREGRIEHNEWENHFYEMALKASGAVQAARWSGIAVKEPSQHAANATSLGYIYSFNGPHSLFVDTMRTTRSLSLAWQLGHVLMHENDKAANLLKRAVLHGLSTSQYILFHGDSSHTNDIAGRTAHEAIFNRNDGNFRCRSSQQGYSPFSTWTRGLAWALLGFAEELEFFRTIAAADFLAACGVTQPTICATFEQAARKTADHYMSDVTALDGVPYWDDGAPGLSQLGDWRERTADPFNEHEPVDSSAAAIAAQGLIRLGTHLGKSKGKKHLSAGLTIAKTLFSEPYLSTSSKHEGLILHSIYHRPNGWDHIPRGRKIPCGESSMWGDYHAIELAVLIQRLARGDYMTFFDR